MTQKVGQKSKIRPRYKLEVLPPNLRICGHLPAPIIYMGEEIAVENGRISDFQRLVTLTLDRVILHTIMHHSSTSTYTPNFIEIEKAYCGRTDGRTDGRTFETHFIRWTWRSRPKNPFMAVALFLQCTDMHDWPLNNVVRLCTSTLPTGVAGVTIIWEPQSERGKRRIVWCERHRRQRTGVRLWGMGERRELPQRSRCGTPAASDFFRT